MVDPTSLRVLLPVFMLGNSVPRDVMGKAITMNVLAGYANPAAFSVLLADKTRSDEEEKEGVRRELTIEKAKSSIMPDTIIANLQTILVDSIPLKQEQIDVIKKNKELLIKLPTTPIE